MKKIRIGTRWLQERPYIIAEAGMNHGGSLSEAKKLALAAKEAGADAIKFQTYEADDLVVRGTPKFWEFGEDEGRDQHEAYENIKKLHWGEIGSLMKYCDKIGIEFLSTPFSFDTADTLNKMGMRAFKVASSDMSTIPYLRHIARFGKPILLSTGAATMEEIRESVAAIRSEGNDQIVVMQCTLCYPTQNHDANIGVIEKWNIFEDFAVGFSDHTLGTMAPVLAAAYGAIAIEKHFTLDKSQTSTADHRMSVTPDELKEIVEACKQVNTLVGSGEKRVLACEKETRMYDKRSIVSKVDIKKDTVITPEMLTYKRPGTGIWPNKITE